MVSSDQVEADGPVARLPVTPQGLERAELAEEETGMMRELLLVEPLPGLAVCRLGRRVTAMTKMKSPSSQ